MSLLNFDARSVAPDTGAQDPVPAGWYNVVMDESEMKPTASGDGQRLAVRFNVLDGPFAGRKLFEGLNLKNSNAVAQEIAFKQLSAIAHAVGVLLVQDSSQLHNIPLKVKVKIKPASGSYDAGNSISAYKNINDVSVGGPGTPAAFAPQAPTAFAPPPIPHATAAAPTAWTPPAAPQPWAAPPHAGPTVPLAAPAAPAAPAWAAAPVQAAPVAPVAPAAPATAAGIQPPWATQTA